MKKIWFDEAWDDYLYWQGQDKKTLKRINAILKDIERKDCIAKRFSKITELAVVSSSKELLNIMSSGVSKGNAIKELAEKSNIDLKQIIAFGDNYNDLEMFNTVGFTVAMGNAVEELKAISSFVTLSNDESGVAYALENIILKHA